MWGKVTAVATRPLSDFDRAASAYIRGVAAAQKLSQLTLAERAGIHINTLRPYFLGERRMGLGDFELICNALGVDPEDAFKEIKRIRVAGNYTA